MNTNGFILNGNNSKRTLKSSLIATILYLICTQVSGQYTRYSISVEYSPNFGGVTQTPYFFDNYEGLRFTNNVFIKGYYGLDDKIDLTLAFGYLTTREFQSLEFYFQPTQSGLLRIDEERYHSYVMANFGLTWYLGSFFISPEIGVGWNVRNRTKSSAYYNDGFESHLDVVDKDNVLGVHEITYPVFLSFGNEINIGDCSMIFGIKGYYSLNSIGEAVVNEGHAYGIGFLTGLKF